MFLVSDRAKASLAANITPADTQIQLASGTGSLFPLPQGNPDDNGLSGYFPLTLVSAGSGVYEICHCTKRDGDLLTVTRGCEGTQANGFITGDLASLNDTAARIRGASQYGHLGQFNPKAMSEKSIQGYAIGALLVDSSGLFFWQNLKDQNKASPGSDNSWLKIDFEYIIKKINTPPPPTPIGVPIGTSIMWNGWSMPENGTWLDENGQWYDKNKFPKLYAVLQKEYVPDSTGRFVRANNIKGGNCVNPDNSNINEWQGDAIRNITGSSYGWIFGNDPNKDDGAVYAKRGNYYGKISGGDNASYESTILLDASRSVPTASENRPISITKRFLIRAA